MNRTRTCLPLLVAVFFAGCGSDYTASQKPVKTGIPQAPTGGVSKAEKIKPGGFSLANYKGKNPVLIVFGDNRDKFMADLSAVDADLRSREVVVIEAFDLSRAYPQAKIRNGEALSEQAASDLRDMFGPTPAGMTLVLIAKDGKVAATEKGAVDPKQLLEKLPAE